MYVNRRLGNMGPFQQGDVVEISPHHMGAILHSHI